MSKLVIVVGGVETVDTLSLRSSMCELNWVQLVEGVGKAAEDL